MNDNYVIHDGQLYHHGIKGMKWGIRRFQNPDGSLTPAGRKRYDDGEGDTWKARREAKRKARAQEKVNNAYRKKSVEDMTPEELKAATERAKLEREHRAVRPDSWKTESEAKAIARAQRAQEKAETEPAKTGKQIRKKSIDDMTTEELAAAIDRARLEDTYRSLRPPEVSKGQKFAESVKSIATKIAEDEGKKFMAKLGDKLLEKYFPNTKKDLDTLKKEAEIDKIRAEAADKWESVRKSKDSSTEKTSKNDSSTEKTSKNDSSTEKTSKNDSSTEKTSKADSSKKETYAPKPEDISYGPQDTRSTRSSPKSRSSDYYEPIVVTDWVDKTADQSTSIIIRDNSNYNIGKTYVSDCNDLTVSELIRKHWEQD